MQRKGIKSINENFKGMTVVMVLFFILPLFSDARIGRADEKKGRGDADKLLFEAGVQRLKQEQYQEAVDLFTEIIFNNREKALVYKNRGVALLYLGKHDLAIRDFQRAMAMDSKLAGINSNLGSAWYYKQEYRKAIDYYTREITNRPDAAAITHFNRAIALAALGRLDSALEDIDRCLELTPDFTGAGRLKKEILGEIGEKGRYTVQAGAYLVAANAESKKADLAEAGFRARILRIRGKKKRLWHLVRIGFFDTEKAANKLAGRLKTREGTAAVVRPAGGF